VPDTHVRLWSRSESAGRAKEHFPAVTSDPVEAVRGTELVVLCVPVNAMGALARQMLPGLSPDCIVTDAGSVKGAICPLLYEILGDRFVGAHPMAGSEQSGITAAREDLYEGATCILTPLPPQKGGTAHARVQAFWKTVGCRTLDLDPLEHDRLVARASHLPHAVASVLAHAISQQMPEALKVCGTGLRDTTRVAAGPADMWSGIFSANHVELLAAINEFKMSLSELEVLIRAGGAPLEAFLARAREVREQLG